MNGTGPSIGAAILVATVLHDLRTELRALPAHTLSPDVVAAIAQAEAALNDALRDLPDILSDPGEARECEIYGAMRERLDYALAALIRADLGGSC